MIIDHSVGTERMSVKEEIEALKFRIGQVEEIVEALKDQLHHLESRYEQEVAQQTLKSAVKTPDSQNKETRKESEKKKVRIDESANTTSIIKNSSAPPVVAITGKPAASTNNSQEKSSSATAKGEGIFEIREFVDDQNKPQQYELLDVTKQLEYMEQMTKAVDASTSSSTSQQYTVSPSNTCMSES